MKYVVLALLCTLPTIVTMGLVAGREGWPAAVEAGKFHGMVIGGLVVLGLVTLGASLLLQP